MFTLNELWEKLRRGAPYRAEFAAQLAKHAIAHQIDGLMAQQGLSQNKLADQSGLSQGAISRAVNPEYGNLTINTLVRIAAGFDVAFVGAFIPFSELPPWFDRFYSKPFKVPTFAEEDAKTTTDQANRSEAYETAIREAVTDAASTTDKGSTDGFRWVFTATAKAGNVVEFPALPSAKPMHDETMRYSHRHGPKKSPERPDQHVPSERSQNV